MLAAAVRTRSPGRVAGSAARAARALQDHDAVRTQLVLPGVFTAEEFMASPAPAPRAAGGPPGGPAAGVSPPGPAPLAQPDPSSTLRARRAGLAGAAGLGLVGAAGLAVAPAQAADVPFPEWVTVTGTLPEDSGLDLAAAAANDWTFSWSTDAQGVVTVVYADGTTSSSVDPVASVDPGRGELSAGVDDLAAAASDPFGLPAAPVAAAPAAPAGAVSDQEVVATAHQGLGGAYVWGGTRFQAWDCSAFVQWVYAQHGIALPRVTWDQFAAAQPTSAPRPGDLVSQNDGAHVGIYLGGDRMISALNPEQGTLVHSVHDMPVDGYYTVR